MSGRPDTAMVFAAGLGTRMRPISNTIPKPLVKVAGKALIDHCLDLFQKADVKRAIVNVHYLADQIEAHLEGRKSPNIIISDEREKLLDQGGGIKKVLTLFDTQPFYICNTDAFWIEGPVSNIARLADAWDPQHMDALLLVAPTQTSVGVDWQGDFHLASDGRLAKRAEGEVADYVYSGVGIIKPQLFEKETQDVFRLAPFFFEAAQKGRLFGCALNGQWLHVGTPAAIDEAEAAIAHIQQ
jgi:N-acetyl-alpha-D-muramate 1-phosphate uridylyltransferase